MSLLDIKTMKAALEQIEKEKHIPREDIIEAIEQALGAAYKKDYGKKGQIIRSRLNMETGDIEFYQVKVVVDDSVVKPELTLEQLEQVRTGTLVLEEDPEDERIRFNGEHHMYIDVARKIKSSVELNEEMVFPLETEEDFGRIAAQTAKQVMLQRIREGEKGVILEQYSKKEGEIVSGVVQKFSRGSVFVDLGRATGMIAPNEKIPGEFYKAGQHIKCYLYRVEEGPRGVQLRLSRSHPRLIETLFAQESPEVASGTVQIVSIAREAGARSKISVVSHDPNIDPIGACVGQRGVRVMTVMSELAGEKIDIVPFAEEVSEYISNALSPASVISVEINEEEHIAYVKVAEDQLSLAIGKEGQNVRLAAKLTGWKIDISGVEGVFSAPEEFTGAERKGPDSGALAAAVAVARGDEETIDEAIDELVADDAPAEEVVVEVTPEGDAEDPAVETPAAE